VRTRELPRPIDLSEAEAALFGQVVAGLAPLRRHEVLQAACVAARKLTQALIERDTIPSTRVQYFTDPDLNIGTKKSRQEVFESNGTHGEAI
jgi:hypothetical protein